MQKSVSRKKNSPKKLWLMFWKGVSVEEAHTRFTKRYSYPPVFTWSEEGYVFAGPITEASVAQEIESGKIRGVQNA